MTFGEAVQESRKAKGLSQGQVARECGWSRSKQSHIETDRYDKPITSEDRSRLGRALGGEFISGDAGATWNVRATTPAF